MSDVLIPQDWGGGMTRPNTFAESMGRAIRNVRSVPNASVIQNNNGGRLFTGRSGIVPFMKNAIGQYSAPGIAFKRNFK